MIIYYRCNRSIILKDKNTLPNIQITEGLISIKISNDLLNLKEIGISQIEQNGIIVRRRVGVPDG